MNRKPMTRPVLLGAGLGLLLLVVAGGTLWFTGREPQRAAPVPLPAVRVPHTVSQAPAATPPVFSPAQTQAPAALQEQREKRQRLAQLRAEFSALRAQGAAASPEKMRAVIDKLQALSPAGLDQRYFQTLRELLDISTRAQTLSQELQHLSQSKAPQDAARRDAILKEIQALGERTKTQALVLQSYASALAPPKEKSP